MPAVRRYEITDFEWSIIQPLLPNKPRGVPRADDRKVFVGGLPAETDQASLTALVGACGSVERVVMLNDSDTGTFKGVAFVTMTTAAEAARACETLNGTKFRTRTLRVNPANAKKPS